MIEAKPMLQLALAQREKILADYLDRNSANIEYMVKKDAGMGKTMSIFYFEEIDDGQEDILLPLLKIHFEAFGYTFVGTYNGYTLVWS